MAIEYLKDEDIKFLDKKKKLEKLLKIRRGSLEEDKFSEFVTLAKKITDFELSGGSSAVDKLDQDDIDVPIEFDDEDGLGEVMDDEDDSEEDSENNAASKDNKNYDDNYNRRNHSDDETPVVKDEAIAKDETNGVSSIANGRQSEIKTLKAVEFIVLSQAFNQTVVRISRRT